MQQQTDSNSSPYYQYNRNPGAGPQPFASAPPVSSTDFSSNFPYLPSNPDPAPSPPQSSTAYPFPHLHHSTFDRHSFHQNPNDTLYYVQNTYANPYPSLNSNPTPFSNSYVDGPSDPPYHPNTIENNVNYGRQGSYDGGVYKYNGGQVVGGRSSDAGSTGRTLFDDYGRPIINNSVERERSGFGSSSLNSVKAVPKSQDYQDVKSNGVQKFRVKLLPEGYGEAEMDVLCQIGLDGIHILDPATSRTLRIYPVHAVTKWEVLDTCIFDFWASTSIDPESRRIRLKSSSYTTNIILDMVTAASIQSKEMGPSSNPLDAIKGTEPSVEKRRGFIDWKNIIKPANEEKDHWVPDEIVSQCAACGTDFNAFNRKHHCRNCGDIFCDKCTQGRINLSEDENAQAVRVCDSCMAEVTQRLSNTKEAPLRTAGVRSHEELARKLQEEMDKKSKKLPEMRSDDSGSRLREVACPTCTVHLQVVVPKFGSETIECSVCQHPFLVNA